MVRGGGPHRVDAIAPHDVAAELGSGKAYLHTHKDVNNRPVIVIRVPKHITGAPPCSPNGHIRISQQSMAR